jgi:TPR repeat protein
MEAPREQHVHGDHSVVAGRDVHIGRLEVHVSATEDAEDRLELPALLSRIKREWIEGVLQELVAHPVPMRFEAAAGDMLVPRWPERGDLPKPATQKLPLGAGVDALFDDANRFLLLLGAEGSGKTAALLQLARCLVERAEDDLRARRAAGEAPRLPRVPIFLSLVTWTSTQPLLDWMVSELGKLHVAGRLARRWLEHGRLTILLDGLDEVHESQRGDCVAAINSFLERACPDGMAVSSRLEEYRAQPQRLKLDAAACIALLSPERVDERIAAGGPRLEGLRDMLGRDPVLRELARSPLLLNTMVVAYEGDAEASELDRPEASAPTSRAIVFERYVQRMFDERGRAMTPEERLETLRRLGWLARQMLGREDVLRVEAMQPSWLPTEVERAAYALVSRALLGVLLGAMLGGYLWLYAVLFVPARPLHDPTPKFVVVGVLFGLALGLADWARFGRLDSARRTSVGERGWKTAAKVLLYWVLYASLLDLTGIGAAWGAVAGWPLVLFFAMRGRHQGLSTDVRPPSGLRWSWRNAGRGAVAGMLAGLLVFGAQGVIYGVGAVGSGWYVWPIIVAILGVAFGGLIRTVDDSPAGIRGLTLVLRVATRGGRTIGGLSFVLGVLSAVIVFAILAVQFSLLHVPLAELQPLVVPYSLLSAFLGAAGALLGALWYGGADAIQHAVLRALLGARGPTPWRLVSFLDVSTHLRLLQRAGGGYRFMHGAFIEHLAARADADRSARPGAIAADPTTRTRMVAALRAYGIRGALFVGSCALLLRAHGPGTHEPSSFRPRFDDSAASDDCSRGDQASCRRLVAHRRKECDLMSGWACADLGEMYEDGKVDRADAVDALPLFRKACALGNGFGCFRMARIRGKAKEDVEPETEALKTMCDEGKSNACFNLAVLYDTAAGVPKDEKRAFGLYERACDAGSGGACYMLGSAYWHGRGGLPTDVARAMDLYERACDAGSAPGCTVVGTAYQSGQGRPTDEVHAASLYEGACDAGFAAGCYDLGWMYQKGLGHREAGAARAADLYESACDGGFAPGCSDLGMAYQYGQGRPPDEARAANLYEGACDAGWALGCNNLGVVYERGQGRTADAAQAVSLYERACHAGLPLGCVNLGDALGGRDKDGARAVHLYEQACDAGEQLGCSRLEARKDAAHRPD